MAQPNPTEVAPWYLRNITQALALDETSGNVYVRTDAQVEIGNVGNLVISDVGVTSLGNVDISGNTMPVSGEISVAGTVAVTQGTDPWTVDGNVNAVVSGTVVSTLAGSNLDAFGRLRVSNPYTLFDSKTRYYDHGQFSNTTSGTANVTYDANASVFNLNVDSASGSKVYNQSFLNFPYQPGKSLLIMETFSMNAKKSGLRQRVGYFTWQNGIYFQMAGTATDGTDKALVIRSSSTGSTVENIVYQNAWNGDRLDGLGGATNPSGITLDPTLDQILWIDIEWLGVGDVRCGFIIDGVFILCHTFHHANTANTPGETDNTTTYMTTATLPLRYEIENTGATGSSSSLRQICQTVLSEGGYNEVTTTESAGTGLSEVTLSTGGTYYPVVSIRLAAGRTEAVVVPNQVDIMGLGEAYFRWKILKNPTLTGATWAGTSSTGTIQYDTGARGNAVTGGTEIQSGFAFSRQNTFLSDGNFFKDQIGRTIGNVSDVITLAIAASQNSKQLFAQIGWEEIT